MLAVSQKKKKKKKAKWCANQQHSILKPCLKTGAKQNLNGKAGGMCPRAPCLLKLFGSFSFSLAFSLISSRQAVQRGLKAFTEPSPGLINTHFLLEILAQTHHRLYVIRWWHSVQPWLKHGHCSIQCLLVQVMHIMETACHQFILESKDYHDILQPPSVSVSRLLQAPACIHKIFSSVWMYLSHRDNEGELKIVKTMETVRQCFAGWDRCNRMPESCALLPSSFTFLLL